MMHLKVHKVQQASSAGSHVTIFEAVFDFVPNGGVTVSMTCEVPEADKKDADRAVEAIKYGFESAILDNRLENMGAEVRVEKIVIHPVDFKPRMFAFYTSKAVRGLLKEVTGDPAL